MGLLSGIVDDESSPLQMEGRVGSPRPIDRASSSSSSSDHLLRPRHVTLPWFETLVAGSRLGGFMLRHSHGILERERAVGSSGVRVEWEIVEWDAAGEDKDMEDGGGADVGVLKRKMDDREADDGAAATT